MTFRILLGTALCIASLGACGDEEKDEGEGPVAEACTADQTWAKVANPILEDNCRSCHGVATAEKLGDGHQFTTEADVREAGHVMYELVESGEMPKGGKMAAADKQALLDWLECSGASKEGEGHSH
jgi:hypothetical protein